MQVQIIEVKFEEVRVVQTKLCTNSEVVSFRTHWVLDYKGNVVPTATVNIEVTYK